MEQCRLCEQRKELRESHIIPRAIIQWELKKRKSYLRNPINPNIRGQDGIKKHLLCNDCEGRFGKIETLFSNKIFYPRVNKDKKDFEYDSWLYYFIISVLWRILVIHKEDKRLETSIYKEELNTAEDEWRKFLYNDVPITKFQDVHLMVVSRQKAPKADSVIDVDTYKKYMIDYDTHNYFNKTFDCSILEFDPNRCVVYCKFNTFFLFAPITPFQDNEWKHTQIINGQGKIIQPQETYDNGLWLHIIDRAINSFSLLRLSLSENQKEKIAKHVEDYHKRNSTDEYR